MSIQASYKFYATPTPFTYVFKSVGEKGEIWKAIMFQEGVDNRFNLAFGDIKGDDFDDKIISNNNDLRMVISTVVSAVYFFWEKNPRAIIEIVGVDERRTKLYNFVFRRRFKELENKVIISGFLNDKWEAYSPEQFYQKFEIRKNSFIFNKK